MGEIIRFVPKSELERTRLIREARAIYDSIFPSIDVGSDQPDVGLSPAAQPGGKGPLPRKETVG